MRFLRAPFDRTVEALEPILNADKPAAPTIWLGVFLLASWYLYVPIHELLHAAGCAWTGGTVTTLEVQEQYGGALLAHWFTFVQPGGEYAGRLSGFDTHGSDLVYLATDALPFLLSLLFGPLLLRLAARGVRPWLAAPGSVLGLAPFYNVPGDYFEMAAIVVTSPLEPRWNALRVDDISRLGTELSQAFAGTGDLWAAWVLVAATGIVAVALAYATWALGDGLARRLLGD